MYFHLLYSLGGNSITDSGAGMLADALKVNQSLQNLRSAADSSYMSGIMHTMGVLHIMHIISNNGMYFHLLCSLDGNAITDKGAGMLADALEVNQSLQNLRSVAGASILYGVQVTQARNSKPDLCKYHCSLHSLQLL